MMDQPFYLVDKILKLFYSLHVCLYWILAYIVFSNLLVLRHMSILINVLNILCLYLPWQRLNACCLFLQRLGLRLWLLWLMGKCLQWYSDRLSILNVRSL